MKTPISLIQKLISIFLVVVIVTVLGIGLYVLNRQHEATTKQAVADDETSLAFTQALAPIYKEPKRIVITSAGIDAAVIPVGVLKDGSLETPKLWLEAGWYKDGAMPGQPGNLLINAHYDDNFGRPAAFWQLKNVKLDDKVTVLDSYGRKYEYKVTDYSLISISDPNRTDVFKSDESAKMTLITCGGVWISGKATYDKRLVIKGELIR